MGDRGARQRPLWITLFVFLHVLMYVWMVASMRDQFNGIILLNALAAGVVIAGLLMQNKSGWYLSFGGLVQLAVGYFILYTAVPVETFYSYAYAVAFVVIIFNFGYLSMPKWQETFGVKEG